MEKDNNQFEKKEHEDEIPLSAEELKEKALYKGDPKGRFKIWREFFDWAEALVFAIVTVILVFTFVFRIITVDGQSMVPTLLDNDRMIISNVMYTPSQGDIVVVNMPNWSDKPFVKRVIAMGGQTVDIDYQSGRILVDGVVLDEPYVNEVIDGKGYDELAFPLEVPEDHIFVVGDNRNHSTDSRSQLVGPVDSRYVMGRIIFQIYPFNEIGIW